jgi:hypothetical protein
MTLGDLTTNFPWGYHDADLLRLEHRWAPSELELDLGFPMDKAQETFRRARLTVTGLVYFAMSPPSPPLPENELPWIDGGPGPGNQNPTRLPTTPDGAFLHHFYLRDSWQYLHVCGQDARLEWLDSTPIEKPYPPLPRPETRHL